MRLIKRQTTNLRSIKGRGVTYDVNDIVTADTPRAFYLPSGSTDERPSDAKNGYMRFNTTLNAIESFHKGQWRKARYSEPVEIVQQRFLSGFDDGRFYGPLDSRPSYTPVDDEDYDPDINPVSPQSMIVLIGNEVQVGRPANDPSDEHADFRLVYADEEGIATPEIQYLESGYTEIEYIQVEYEGDVPVDARGWYIEFFEPNTDLTPVTVVHNFDK